MAEFWIPGATLQKCTTTNLPISWCPPKVSSLIVHNLTDNNMVSDTIWHLKATLVEVLLVDDLKNRSICIWPKVENVNLQVVHIWTTSLVCFCCILQKFRSVVVSKTVGLFNLCTQPLVRRWICNNVVCKLLRMRSLIPETDAQTHLS